MECACPRKQNSDNVFNIDSRISQWLWRQQQYFNMLRFGLIYKGCQNRKEKVTGLHTYQCK